MMNYEVTVFTGNLAFATTFNNVYIKLVGTDGESKHTRLTKWKPSFYRGAESHFDLSCSTSLGKLVLIELDKETKFLADSWYAARVKVTSPEGDTYHFPIYHWITDGVVHCFREGAALRIFEDSNSLFGKYSRQQELDQQREIYRWDVYEEGIPHCIKADSFQSLPCDSCFSLTKTAEMAFTAVTGLAELELIKIAECKRNFTSIEDISHLLCVHRTEKSEYVRKHWKDDIFFGYQFLNGINPMLIQRCTTLPKNFPVTDNMVFPHGQHSLADEIEKGNIFLCDYKLLDGIEGNTINGKKQYLMAPLILLQKTCDGNMIPVAIQLKQKPAEDNPIFLPTDSEYDWLIAKIFVKSADFNFFELSVHLLRTHMLVEVYTLSLLQNLPMVHPLYKLLIPHTRYTLEINFLARKLLLSKDGDLAKFTSSGGEGAMTILKRSMSSLTYSSLCIPDDIAERGLDDVPNFCYRDDGLKLWEIIHRFVKSVLCHYYKTDDEVQQDSELQNWIREIFEHGFLSQESSGIPQKFTSVDEMVKFVTMVIFTCSAQHSAVNSGQYDFGAWMPNSPTSLQLPPPTKKGTASEQSMLDSFPDVNTTVHGMAILWLLSKQSSDSLFLGQYPDQHFTEDVPHQKIREFQEDLKKLSADIKARNKSLKLPYTYLDPAEVENSVSI
ncbi:hydroperoxide isomerase ALOXE3-like [Archocentrus centrarchus]|uniref:hydroperoxide isomerase ALOXE3-like n=1 Tax=Archocentrus centrarchus TaxID=63155 RepID=UPI0011EA4295|nr:hydroperoxide isomerase ALOXE3-like [Archocentrus centrarchus]